MQTAYDANGTDWITLVIPPEDIEEESEYVIRVNASFLMSNWGCIYGQGCPGQFGDQTSTYADDTGCCGDSFYVSDRADADRIAAQIENLTDEDWDTDLRAHVSKHGWLKVINKGNPEDPDGDTDGFTAKGKVTDGGCVFQNRNGGSAGKPGCAFVHMASRLGGDHIDVMPDVCWTLPLRFGETDENVYELTAWTIDQWHTDAYPYLDFRYTHRWWCVDSPEAYRGDKMLYRTMERELRKLMGDRPYELVVQALEARMQQGWKPMPMPGAVRNDGRPLLPMLIGNRTPKREPTNYPAILAQMSE